MKNVNPQYTFDHVGNPIGVFLPIEEWNQISDELKFELPGWQKALIDERLQLYKENPDSVIDFDIVADEFDKEDGAL